MGRIRGLPGFVKWWRGGTNLSLEWSINQVLWANNFGSCLPRIELMWPVRNSRWPWAVILDELKENQIDGTKVKNRAKVKEESHENSTEMCIILTTYVPTDTGPDRIVWQTVVSVTDNISKSVDFVTYIGLHACQLCALCSATASCTYTSFSFHLL